jgi:hypothetical protein
MKILDEVRDIDKYLFDKLDEPSELVFEARMLIDPTLKLRVEWQKRIYAIVRLSGRRRIRNEAERIHRQLFDDPTRSSFQQDVLQLFTKK